ncbi:hyaluronidase-2 isoform X2 [Chelonia mydas]|uniref:hyaluronidase-2 isoform X2 n=2 Tax=Chelonia mydas TaxID=8469 RepID=UPI001CA98AC3|nr:hyaluronidase-2 isoform X2 [Chelonia mydas]
MRLGSGRKAFQARGESRGTKGWALAKAHRAAPLGRVRTGKRTPPWTAETESVHLWRGGPSLGELRRRERHWETEPLESQPRDGAAQEASLSNPDPLDCLKIPCLGQKSPPRQLRHSLISPFLRWVQPSVRGFPQCGPISLPHPTCAATRSHRKLSQVGCDLKPSCDRAAQRERMRGGSALAVPWLLLLAVPGSRGQDEKPTFAPLFTRKPFIVAWNAPTQDCRPRFKVQLDFSLFDLQASPNEGFVDQNLTIFYKERLGRYPYYDEQQVAVNGGVPQNSSLTDHLDRLQEGIRKYIRSEAKEGLAVIDWEEWRPIWIRNWQNKDVYRKNSRQLVLLRHPSWQEDLVNKEAQYEFESSAQKFMLLTLQHAKSYRPKQLWGYYLFPDCYNHDYSKNPDSYTGRCPDVEETRNDRLAWLWKESTALYPSIYLDQILASSENGRKFVRSRVMEALRISHQHHDGYSLPVFVYTRPTYSRKLDVLSRTDLVSTIGESAALGAAGAIFWGDADYTKSQSTCQTIKAYLEEELGHYIINVTTAAQRCSQALCQGRGRCRRRDSTANVFLHLNPLSFQIRRRGEADRQQPLLRAEGELSATDTAYLRTHFRCQCYQGWHGDECERQLSTHNSAACPACATLGLLVLGFLARLD